MNAAFSTSGTYTSASIVPRNTLEPADMSDQSQVREVENLAERALSQLSENSGAVAEEFELFLSKIRHKVDGVGPPRMVKTV